MYRVFVTISLLLILLCLTPVLGVAWSSWMAERHDCVLNEAGAHPCIVNGQNLGGLMGFAFVSGWFGLITLPLAALIGALLLLVTLIRAYQRRQR